MIDIFKQGGDWHIRHEGQLINMNTEEASTLLLSLFERIEMLEIQVHKKQKQPARTEKMEDGDE